MTRQQRAFKVVGEWLKENPEMKTAIQQGLNGPLGSLAQIICMEIGEAMAEERKACKEIALKEGKDIDSIKAFKSAVAIARRIEMRGESDE